MPGGSGSGPKDCSARPRSATEPKRTRQSARENLTWRKASGGPGRTDRSSRVAGPRTPGPRGLTALNRTVVSFRSFPRARKEPASWRSCSTPRGQMQFLSAQLAGTQHAERSARIVNQIKGLSSLAEKPVPVARLGGGNFDKAGDTSRVQDSIDPKDKSDVEANKRS